MNTPICAFVNNYIKSNALRLHMPGHKGSSFLGMEGYDITEINGADSLYEADGIIRESEKNASDLFGCDTFYSTEGSSQCIRAMLCLALMYGKEQGRKPVVLAGRNAHKTFMSAAALLDFDIQWLYGEESYLSCSVCAKNVEKAILSTDEKPVAVYLTSPDYLGNTVDIRKLSSVCRKHNVLLLVDNAHGAYLKFLPQSRHPIDLGADMCCDSAHKTLPVLTGGAYLHISKDAPSMFKCQAKSALALFGSTSPSYLILQSLDYANKYIAEDYSVKLSVLASKVQLLKNRLIDNGYTLTGDEPLKLTFLTKSYGYTGIEFAEELERCGIICEFADPDYVVLMLTPETGEEGLLKIEKALIETEKKEPIKSTAPMLSVAERAMSVREAMLSPKEEVLVEQACGRILADASVGCPPAVPIAACGERIDKWAVDCFKYYGIDKCMVVKDL